MLCRIYKTSLLCFLCYCLSLDVLAQDKTELKPKTSACSLDGNITGNSCLGSILTLSANLPLKSIKWTLNNSTTLYQQTAGFEKNATIIAGGNGNGSGLNQLYSPNRFFVDDLGDIYIPDMTNNRVVKWTPGALAGVVVAGGNGAGIAANQFNRPTSVVVDKAGNIYVADQNNNRIQKWAPGTINGTTFTSNISAPTALAIDKNGNIYASNQTDDFIQKFPLAGGNGTIVAGNGSALSSPTGIFVNDQNNIYICDTDNNRIVRWTPGASSGTVVAGGNGYGSATNQLANPLGICVDKDGTMFISDYNNNRVIKWDAGASSGTILAGTGTSGSNITQLTPVGIYLDPGRNLIVGDFGNGRVLKFANNILYRYTTTQAASYTATIESTDNCVFTTNAIVISTPVTSNISISSTSQLICSSTMPVFTAIASGAGNSPVYQWKVNGINAALSSSAIFNPTSLNDKDKISCEVISSETCITSAKATSNVIEIIKGDLGIQPTISISADKLSSCKDTRFIFTAVSSNEGQTPDFSWFVNGNKTGTNSKTISLELKDEDEVYCSLDTKLPCINAVKSNSVKVRVSSSPKITLTRDTTVLWGEPFELKPVVTGDVQKIIWRPATGLSNPEIMNPAVNPKENQTYTLELTNSSGCTSTASININVIHQVEPPKTFTPNGDDNQDVWQIKGISAFPQCQVSVFNRAGKRVFYSVGYNAPWDGTHVGTPVMAGPYYYIIKLDEKETLTGNINIVR